MFNESVDSTAILYFLTLFKTSILAPLSKRLGIKTRSASMGVAN